MDVQACEDDQAGFRITGNASVRNNVRYGMEGYFTKIFFLVA